MFNYKNILEILEKEPQLIELKNDKDTVFIGDTHGDSKISKRVIEKYPLGENRHVFIGDYVDRGPDSKGNIDYLLEMKEKHPEDLYLLGGNHEFFPLVHCNPCDFWMSLGGDIKYGNLLPKLPLAVSIDGIIALHAALPEIKKIEEINKIAKKEERKLRLPVFKDENDNFMAMSWGDFVEGKGKFKGYSGKGRPEYGGDYFKEIMGQIGKNVLIRGHDYHVPEKMYENRCLTLFTTCAYNVPKRIAILKAGTNAKTADDLTVEYL
jgi:hypothetical protein